MADGASLIVDRDLIRTVRSRLRWWRLSNLCPRLTGHWLANVEEGVARCRICKTLIFCPHADDEAVFRVLLGHASTCAYWSSNPPKCTCGGQS